MIRLAVVMAAFGLSGCGTVGNFGMTYPGEGPRVYGGVCNSLRYAGVCAEQVGRRESGEDVAAGCIGAAFSTFVDAPLSAIADTLTLPLVLRERARLARERAADAPPASTPREAEPLLPASFTPPP
jgi:uncharacterized protein YceK